MPTKVRDRLQLPEQPCVASSSSSTCLSSLFPKLRANQMFVIGHVHLTSISPLVINSQQDKITSISSDIAQLGLGPSICVSLYKASASSVCSSIGSSSSPLPQLLRRRRRRRCRRRWFRFVGEALGGVTSPRPVAHCAMTIYSARKIGKSMSRFFFERLQFPILIVGNWTTTCLRLGLFYC